MAGNATKVWDGTTWQDLAYIATGPQGPAGSGIAAGGTAGQRLVKASAMDYATQWETDWPEAQHFVGQAGEPTFENAWSNFDAFPSRALRFYRDRDRVYLQGVVKGGTVGATIFTLPAAYRFTDSNRSYIATMAGGIGTVTVNANGTVTAAGVTAGTLPANFTFLDGMSYRIT